jgi:hypothetical protein
MAMDRADSGRFARFLMWTPSVCQRCNVLVLTLHIRAALLYLALQDAQGETAEVDGVHVEFMAGKKTSVFDLQLHVAVAVDDNTRTVR